jgi:aspartokinase-like uncharacterized kinase
MGSIDIVVKIGGGLLAYAGALDATLAIVQAAARTQHLLVVPGGGPFADAVREVDRRLRLSDDAAHWMAVLAMDQYAHLLAERLNGTPLVTHPSEIAATVIAEPARPVMLAPYRWLREADPLPHSWKVTSDSIAAWIAGQVGARTLVLVKPPGATNPDVVDPYFRQALPPHVRSMVLSAGGTEALRAALDAATDL